MTTTSSAVRLWWDEGVLAGQCDSCGVYLELLDDRLGEEAERAFLDAHPSAAGHSARPPRGWVQPLSGPGAWSQ